LFTKAIATFLLTSLTAVLTFCGVQSISEGGWSTLAPMPTARQETSAAVLKGKIYVIAGYDINHNSTNTVEVYDPRENSWSSAAPLPIVTNHNAAAVADGTLFAFGGTSSRVFAYHRRGDAWSEVGSLRFQHGNTPAVAVIEDRIYVAGGTGPGMNGNELEVYNPSTNTWIALASMNVGRNHCAGGTINGKFYVVGGRGNAMSPSAFEAYDPQTNTWTTLAPLPTPRSGIAAGVLNQELYVFGGEQPRVFGDVEVYNPVTNTWRQVSPMPTPRHGIWAAVIDNSIYIPGGATQQGFGATNITEAFSLPPTISGATINGKRLIVEGKNFDEGATVLLNGDPQKTANDESNPNTMLVAKKAGKKISTGEVVTLQVQNFDGSLSAEFRFTRP
jgi:N-acetylneuraminic acid mutarotase